MTRQPALSQKHTDSMDADHAPLVAEGSVRLKACRHGPIAYLATDIYIGRSLDLYGEYSEGEAELFAQVLKPGQTAVEAGANIGTHTVAIAKAVGSAGAVAAFEPQRVLHQLLCANVALNALSHVHAHQAALGREAGTIPVPKLDYAAENNFGGIALGQAGAGETVAVATIDAMGLAQCHFIKIDVEGMEGDVIAGAEQTIRRCRPLLYLENDRADSSAALIQQLFGLGYRLYWHLPRLFNPENYFGQAENVFGDVISINMLGVPEGGNAPVAGLHEVRSPQDDWKPLALAELRRVHTKASE